MFIAAVDAWWSEAAVAAEVDSGAYHLSTDMARAGADTVYLHLYDVADLDHVRLLGREVLPRLT